MEKIITMGIDIGSTATKCVIMENGSEIMGKSVFNLGAGTKGVGNSLKEALEMANLTQDDIHKTVATGYGRNTFEHADKTISELSAHAKGGVYIFGDIHTIIDIGGQDIKVLNIDDKGNLANFLMNDKCAAGTGRFIEVMSKVLDVPLDELGDYDAQATEVASISSTCTVFAESEVISSMANNIPIPNIVRGIHQSVATRVAGLAKRGGLRPPVALTGGLSRDPGLVRALSDVTDSEIKVSADSQLAGAIGAAIYAYEEMQKELEREDSNDGNSK